MRDHETSPPLPPRREGDEEGEVSKVALVESTGELERLAERLLRAPRLGLDIEANGLFAYRASLCILSIGWEEDGQFAVAVVDTLETSLRPLEPVLGPEGPTKVLHDLHFDARMLESAGAPLARVRDTAVAAQLLGFAATGLGALVASEFGITLDKRLQRHDWSKRPLSAEQLSYLSGDVRHLLPLDDHLSRRAEALEITAEIEEECAYRLTSARSPPRDQRPAYARIKGAQSLDPPGRAVLRRLVEAREAQAEAADVPPFRVASNEALLSLARRRPTTVPALLQGEGRALLRGGMSAEVLLSAIAEGTRDGDVAPDDRAFFEPRARAKGRAEITALRAIEARITAFREAEAERRGVHPQVVLPGHCAKDLADAILAHGPEDPALPAAIARIAGLGEVRLSRYGEALLSLAKPPS